MNRRRRSSLPRFLLRLGAEIRPFQLTDLAFNLPPVAVDSQKARGELDRLLHRFPRSLSLEAR